ncbi:MAG: hypothetical protein HYS12_17960 [Planctomycetes bacterium]|nr:hypothetical protein [Planctomycetota bacterium]
MKTSGWYTAAVGFVLLGGSHAMAEPPRWMEWVMIEGCKRMSPLDLDDFVGELGARRDFDALRAIYNSSFPCSSFAAGEYARRLEADKVVAFCNSLPLRSANCPLLSANWRAAVYALRCHPRAKVIDYLRKLAESPSPDVRYLCYSVCMGERWGDLVEVARKDIDNYSEVNLPNLGEDELTIAQTARKYIQKITGEKLADPFEPHPPFGPALIQ